MNKQVLFDFVSLILLINSCSNTGSSVNKEIEKANFCNTKEDCIDTGSKCPFGCYSYVNKNEASRIKSLIDNYESNCVYSCIACFDVKCENNKCVPVCDMPLA
ncbi:MAG TPA: hypothetical protein VI564_03955 [Candidatus Nanoarchaeia archaeon]|nr:hypothetical protein [Candidatus Nanoarchaeia archaeon]